MAPYMFASVTCFLLISPHKAYYTIELLKSIRYNAIESFWPSKIQNFCCICFIVSERSANQYNLF